MTFSQAPNTRRNKIFEQLSLVTLPRRFPPTLDSGGLPSHGLFQSSHGILEGSNHATLL